MDKTMCVICCVVLAVAMAGCATKIYTVTQDRADIQVAGNQGVIFGPVPAPYIVEKTQREVTNIDIEFPTMEEVQDFFDTKSQKRSKTEDTAIWGNAGDITPVGQSQPASRR